jgi:hypothetical protein
MKSGKVVSPKRRPPGTHFCYTLSRTQDHSAARRIMVMKNCNDTFGNRNCDLPACSAVRHRVPSNYNRLVSVGSESVFFLHKIVQHAVRVSLVCALTTWVLPLYANVTWILFFYTRDLWYANCHWDRFCVCMCEYYGCHLSISFQPCSTLLSATSRIFRPRHAGRMQAAKLYYAARGHFSKLCIYQNNIAVI